LRDLDWRKIEEQGLPERCFDLPEFFYQLHLIWNGMIEKPFQGSGFSSQRSAEKDEF
jgi:hypothetical protein